MGGVGKCYENRKSDSRGYGDPGDSNPGEALKVRLWSVETEIGRSLYAQLGRDSRFTVPKIVAEDLEVEPGEVLECKLYRLEQV